MSTSADPSHLQGTPPARALLRLITGNHVSRAIYVMAKLGIADLLRDGPKAATGSRRPRAPMPARSIECCAPWLVSVCSSKMRRRASG
jgi:hypothetical protein